DVATVARHPALAEFRLMELEARCAALQASLLALLARPEPLAPDAVRARLGRLPIHSEDFSEAI
ncbi:MAG: hypothetical protein ACN6OP_29950, partial [Pseudomonadales bacterium]